MNKLPGLFLFTILFLVTSKSILAQDWPFTDEIKSFKDQDKKQFPAPHQILFVGSSSFRKWQDVQKYFPSYPILNRGFGGSSLPDVIHFAKDIIFPYKPKQVVIYCGDNDLAASDTVSAKTVFNRFVELFHLIRKNLPGEPIAFISIKPSPSRAQLMPKIEEANKMIRAFMRKQKNASFVDVYHKMLASDGQPVKGLFIEDQLHMNAKGYAIWQKAIQPYLLK
jgi:lysophospholipase L1-like esterase